MERLKRGLPDGIPGRSCLHASYMQNKALELAEKEFPDIAEQMKRIRRRFIKTGIVTFIFFALTAVGDILT